MEALGDTLCLSNSIDEKESSVQVIIDMLEQFPIEQRVEEWTGTTVDSPTPGIAYH